MTNHRGVDLEQRFNEDINEALEYVSTAECFGLRNGKEFYKKQRVNIPAIKSELVVNHHRNSEITPMFFKSKPKKYDRRRIQSLRKALINHEALDDKYRIYEYETAGICKRGVAK